MMQYLQSFWVLFLTLSLISLSFQSCKEEDRTLTVNNCPTEFVCKASIIKDSIAVIYTDEFNKSYVQLKYSKDLGTLKVEYTRASIDSISDSYYKEEIFMNYDNQFLKTVDQEIESKVIYGRIGNFRNSNSHFVDNEALVSVAKKEQELILFIGIKPEIPLEIVNHEIGINNL